MLHGFIRHLFIVLGVLLSATVSAQNASEDPIPTLYLIPNSDGTIWVELALPSTAEHVEEVSSALATVLGEQDPSYVGEFYDGVIEDVHAWSAYGYDALEEDSGSWVGALNLAPLGGVLRELKQTQLDVTIYDTPPYVNLISWNGTPVETGQDENYQWAVFSLDAPLPSIEVTCKRMAATNVAHYLPLPLLLLATALVLYLLRRRALRYPPEEVGFACYRSTRRLVVVGLTFWLLTGLSLYQWSPLEPLVYGVDGLAGYHELFLLVLWVVLGTAMAMVSRIYFLPVYLRLPGARWTARDLAAPAFYFSMVLSVILVTVFAVMLNLHQSPVQLVSVLFVGALAGAYCYVRMLLSLGFVIQALDEGELYERVRAMADQAKISSLRGVYLVYRDKCPVLNALAAHKMQVMFTEHLLEALTRREVDAIVGHELSHLVRNHPKTLYRARGLCMVLGWILGVVCVIGMTILVASLGLYWHATAWICATVLSMLPGFLLGYVLYLSYSRRFEFEADRGAVELTEDPEALISGLVKLTRLNYMPMVWGGRWGALFITHPETRKRVDAIATRFGVSEERVEELLDGESVGHGHYPIPANARPDRLFRTQDKSRNQIISMIQLLILPALVPVVGVWAFHFFDVRLPFGLGVMAMVLGGLMLVALYQDRTGLRSVKGLAKRFRDGRGLAEDDGSTFVTLAPNDRVEVYDGSLAWDVGMVAMNAEGLHFLGDGTSFTLTRDQIVRFEMQRVVLGLIPVWRLVVSYQLGEEADVRTLALVDGDGGRMSVANRKTRALFEQLTLWQRDGVVEGTGMLPDVPYGAPEKLTVSGVPMGAIAGLRQRVVFSSLVFGIGCALGTMVGLPPTRPFVESAVGVGAIAAFIDFLAAIPGLWMAYRDKNGG